MWAGSAILWSVQHVVRPVDGQANGLPRAALRLNSFVNSDERRRELIPILSKQTNKNTPIYAYFIFHEHTTELTNPDNKGSIQTFRWLTRYLVVVDRVLCCTVLVQRGRFPNHDTEAIEQKFLEIRVRRWLHRKLGQ